MIPFLKKMLGRIGNPLDKGWRTKKYDDIKPFQKVKVIRYDLSKQEQKGHRRLLPRPKLSRKDFMKKGGDLYF
jgi:hypothetical protein